MRDPFPNSYIELVTNRYRYRYSGRYRYRQFRAIYAITINATNETGKLCIYHIWKICFTDYMYRLYVKMQWKSHANVYHKWQLCFTAICPKEIRFWLKLNIYMVLCVYSTYVHTYIKCNQTENTQFFLFRSYCPARGPKDYNRLMQMEKYCKAMREKYA